MDKKKVIFLSIIVSVIGMLITTGTFAFFTWQSNINKGLSFNIASNLKNYIEYDNGDSTFVGDFQVSNIFTDGIHSTISVKKKQEAASIQMVATINMDINAIGPNMAKSSALKWVVTSGNSSSVGPILSQGNFIGSKSGDTLMLLPNIELTTSVKEYTIWIWLDASEHPSDALSGETLDTAVWTQIEQLAGMEEIYEITKISVNYQRISATVINNKNVITKYAITTSNNTPTSWISIDTNLQNNIYNLEYDTSATGTYYVWFMDSASKTVSASIQVTNIDNTPPSCTFGSFNPVQIANNETSQIILTCTDAESTIENHNLTKDNLITSSSVVNVTNVRKEQVTNGYKYTITVTGTETDGIATLTLPANTIRNSMHLGNTITTSTASVTVRNIIDLSSASITLNPNSFVYDGTAKTPSITVTLDGDTLTRNTDYSASFTNNINVGTATVYITGINDYEGSASATFTITGASIDAGMSLTGTPTWGEDLNITPTCNVPSSGCSYSYQWYESNTNSTTGGSAITGATSSTYAIEMNKVNKYIYVVVTITANNYETKEVATITPTKIAKRYLDITTTNYSGVYDGSIHYATIKVNSQYWNGTTIVSGTSTTYGNNVTTTGTVNTTYNLLPGLTNATNGVINIYYQVTGGSYYRDTTGSATINITKTECDAPTNVTITPTGLVNWTNVENATGYEISIDGTTYTEATNGINYNSTITASTGTRTVYVRSVCNSNYNSPSNSASASTTVYNVTLTAGSGISTISGAGNYITGATVSINATLDTDYAWVNWTQTSGGSVVSTTQAYSATITSNWSYTANVIEKVYSYTTSSGTVYTNTLVNAFTNVSNNGTITALKDNTSNLVITNSKNVTLNTNEKIITLTQTITNSSTLTINGGGTITTSGTIVLIDNSGNLTTSSVTLSKNNNNAVIRNSGTYTSNTGTIINNTVEGGISMVAGTMNFNNGIINVAWDGIYKYNDDIGVATLNVSGGSINGGNVGIISSASTNNFNVNMSNGSVTGTVSGINSSGKMTINVTGGYIYGSSQDGLSCYSTSITCEVTITSGTIIGYRSGLFFNRGGSHIVGTNDGTINSNPTIVGLTNYGINGSYSVNWYDGAVYGIVSTGNFYTAPYTIPTGYHTVTVADTTYIANGYKSYLYNKYTITANASGGSITSTSGWTGTGSSATKDIVYNGPYGQLPTASKTGYTFEGWTLIPNEYQQVEYIESTGAQYIDTGVHAKETTGFYIDFITTDAFNTSTFGAIFGSFDNIISSGTATNRMEFNTWAYNYPNGTFHFGAVNGTNEAIPANLTSGTRITASLKNGVYTDPTGQTTNVDTTPFTAEHTLFLFARIYEDSIINAYAHVKLYSFKLYDGNTLIRDFIPCYRKSDGVAGLYDNVDHIFYTNQGSGTFNIGNNTYVTASTINDIESNHTLYAQWCENVYSYTTTSGTAYTNTLNSAFTNVSNNGTITALKDNTSNIAITNNKNVALNTNGKTITLTSVIVNLSGASLTIIGGGTITGDNITLIGNNAGTLTTSSVTIANNSPGNFTINNGTNSIFNVNTGTNITNSSGGGIALFGGTVNFNNGTMTTAADCISASSWSATITTLNVSGGTITSSSGNGIAASANTNNFVVTVSGGSIIGGNVGIINHGKMTANITGGYIYGGAYDGLACYSVSTYCETTVTGGTIVGYRSGIFFNHGDTHNIGSNDGTVNSTPVIVGLNQWAIQGSYSFNWYDGVLHGVNGIRNFGIEPYEMPTGYGPVTVADNTYSGGYKTYLTNSYTVHFNSNGGSGSMSDEAFSFGTAKALTNNAFTKTNYGFTGWSTSSSDTNVVYDNHEYISDNTSGSTSINIKQYTIAAPFTSGEVYQVEVDAKGSGYFESYFYGASGYLNVANWVQTTLDSSSSGTNGDGHSNMTLTSSYKHYTIRYTLGSSGNGNLEKYLLFRVQPGQSVTFKNVRFYKVSANSKSYVNGQTVKNIASTQTVNLYAIWGSYTVQFNANGGSGSMANESFQYETAKTLTTNTFTRTGYTFTGWSTSSSDKNVVYDNNEYNYDYSTYNSNNYYNLKEYVVTSPFATGEVYQLHVDVKGSGTLINYFYGDSGYMSISSIQTYDGNGNFVTTTNRGDGQNSITLSNTYTHYTVRFILGSGSGNVNKRLLFRVYGGTNVTFKNVRLYKVSANSTAYTDGQTVKNVSSTPTGNLYAMWTPNTYTITYDTRGGTLSGGKTITNLTTDGSFEGTTLLGTQYNASLTRSNDKAYDGQYSIAAKNVSGQFFARFKALGATNIAGKTAYMRVKYLRTTTDISTGVYFYSAQTNADWPSQISQMTGGDDMWKNGSVNTWINNSVQATMPYNYFFYQLANGNGSASGTGSAYFDDLMLIDLTTAYGSGNEPSRSYMDNIAYFEGSTTLYTQSKTYGTTLGTLPTNPTKSGYNFAGWWTAPSGGTQITTSTPIPNGDTVYYAHWAVNTYTATFYYQSNATAGATTLASTTAYCQITSGTSCTITIPNAVRSSVGTWNNAYAGLSTSVGNMTQAVASNATAITVSSNMTYYSLYRTPYTIHYPNTTSQCTSATIYRNQWFTSTSAMANTVGANTTTGTTTYTPSYPSGYSPTRVTSASNNVGTVLTAGCLTSTATVCWITTTKTVAITNTYYYNNNTNVGSTTIASTTSSSNTTQSLYCTSTSAATAINAAVSISIPDAVRSSVGTWNIAYDGITAALSTGNTVANASATTISVTASSSYYAWYSSNVTLYRPSSTTACTVETWRKTQYFTSTSALSTTVLRNTAGSVNYAPTMVSGYNFHALTTDNATGGSAYTVASAALTTATTFWTTATVAVTATFKYSNNATGTVASTTASGIRSLHCTGTTTAAIVNGPISRTIPGTAPYGTTAVGWSTGVNSIASVSPNTGTTTYYASYRGNVTIYKPSSESACSAITMYRNSFMNAAGATTYTAVLTTTNTSVGNTNPAAMSWYGFNKLTTSSTNTGTSYTLANAAVTSTTTFWATYAGVVNATFKYSSNASGTVASTTASNSRLLYCTSTANATTYNNAITPSLNQTAPYGTTAVGWTCLAGRMTDTTTTPGTGCASWFAVYRANVTNYYYNNGYTNRTIYRNSFMAASANTAYTTVLSTSNTGTANYTTAVGPNNAAWAGLATTATSTVQYSTVASAAVTTATTLYTIYQYNITYSIGTNVSSIGANSGYCRFTTGATSCNITLPSITTASSYTAIGWDTSSGTSYGYIEGCVLPIVSTGTTLYANALPSAACVQGVGGGGSGNPYAACVAACAAAANGVDHPACYEACKSIAGDIDVPIGGTGTLVNVCALATANQCTNAGGTIS